MSAETAGTVVTGSTVLQFSAPPMQAVQWSAPTGSGLPDRPACRVQTAVAEAVVAPVEARMPCHHLLTARTGLGELAAAAERAAQAVVVVVPDPRAAEPSESSSSEPHPLYPTTRSFAAQAASEAVAAVARQAPSAVRAALVDRQLCSALKPAVAEAMVEKAVLDLAVEEEAEVRASVFTPWAPELRTTARALTTRSVVARAEAVVRVAHRRLILAEPA